MLWVAKLDNRKQLWIYLLFESTYGYPLGNIILKILYP